MACAETCRVAYLNVASNGSVGARSLARYDEEAASAATTTRGPRAWLQLGGSTTAVDKRGLLQEQGQAEEEEEVVVGRSRRRRRLCLSALLPSLAVVGLLWLAGQPVHEEEDHFQLEGQVRAGGEAFLQYIGGFCFGRTVGPQHEYVGTVHFILTMQHFLASLAPPNGTLHVLVYDDEDRHWGVMRQRWNASSVTEQTRWANWAFKVNLSEYFLSVKPRDVDVKLHVFEHYTRHWHLVLLCTGMRPDFSLQYKAVGYKALSKFGPEPKVPEACPRQVWRDMEVRARDAEEYLVRNVL